MARDRRRVRGGIQSSHAQHAHSWPRALKCMDANSRHWLSSASLATGPERKDALNIWNVTPADAMLTPRNSRTSPAERLAAITRKLSRRLSATFRKVTELQYRAIPHARG